MKKIISYNVNGLRAAINKDISGWIQSIDPDIICFQETKLQIDQFDENLFTKLGYHSFLFSAQKKGYSGVAILSKEQPIHVEYGIGIDIYDNEGRMIRADFNDFSVASVYHPSGTSGDVRQSFKMKWLEDWTNYVEKLRKSKPKLVLCGDYNICHEEIDIHDPIRNATNSGFLPEEREWISNFLKLGYIDSFRYKNPKIQKYSWWSYRFNSRKNNKGWRIDYCMTTENLKNNISGAYIHNDATHSDHCPIEIDID